jgi:hypothetical protein
MATTTFKKNRLSTATLFLITAFSIVSLLSCNKDDIKHHPNKPASYPADVLDKWMTLQLRLMRNATGIPNQGFARHFAYTGVAALESLAPGLPAHASWTKKWNGLTGLPQATPGRKYYYPANINAAMAAINKAMFPNATSIDKAAIDSLEKALDESFHTTQSPSLIAASSSFGKAVADAVFKWAETDGYNIVKPYNPPVGQGLWVPTAPGFASAATPYWGDNRTIISGSIEGTEPPAPPPYSTDPSSPFYQMVKQVYDVSQTLTDEQKAMAIFWRDVPGATSPGHWLSIVQQVVRQKAVPLDKAALAYALTGVAINDALISCFKYKYQTNLVRPITYIREVMGHTTWTPQITTPAHPEYVSAHANLSGASASVLEKLFGNVGSFTDHTYDYLGFAPRTYSSFTAIGEDAAQSRLYAGIHYQISITAGLLQGRKVADNIFSNHNGQ